MTSRASRAPDRPLPVEIAKSSFRNELRRLSLRCRARVVMKRVLIGEIFDKLVGDEAEPVCQVLATTVPALRQDGGCGQDLTAFT